MGTLGRQGSCVIFQRLKGLLQSHGKKLVLLLMAEIVPDKVAKIRGVDVSVKVASICWLHFMFTLVYFKTILGIRASCLSTSVDRLGRCLRSSDPVAVRTNCCSGGNRLHGYIPHGFL
jgi:Putative diphthamide synthesis protein